MNNKIIQVRGGNAAGKTTLIKKFIENYTNVNEYEIEIEKNLKSKLTSINNNEIILKTLDFMITTQSRIIVHEFFSCYHILH